MFLQSKPARCDAYLSGVFTHEAFAIKNARATMKAIFNLGNKLTY